PALVIKYKVLYKLRRNEVITNLKLKIRPERDVITKDNKGFRFILKLLTTIIIT
ncbi:uncharacterized protein CLUP02_08037, partial [Colletotrichum lupini]